MLRAMMIDTCLQMQTAGINQGTSGNVSVRYEDGFLVTPSGRAYEDCQPEDMIFVDDKDHSHGPHRPSSEWRMHKDIYLARPEVNAILHAHPSYATTLACANLNIPAFHYMIAVAGGEDIRCAPYATFGTQALSDHIITALEGRLACLIAHHGVTVVGGDLKQVLALAIEVEALAKQYWQLLQLGEPVLLPAEEMAVILEKFKDYKSKT